MADPQTPSAPFLKRVMNSARLAAWMLRERRAAWQGREAIERARDRRLHSIVRYAYRRVPYYQETMRRLG